MKSTIPAFVLKIIKLLTQKGFPAYVAGGAVRDLLLGREPYDFDIATAARPEEVLAIAKAAGIKVIDNLGQNFGVVILLAEGHAVEVATFRGERYGEDAHRPAAVWYSNTLEEDLARRDFTVNAMALSAAGAVIDPYHGREDLARLIIRAVGNPAARFHEDALRMFRACRFAAQLGFSLERETLAGIPLCLDRVGGLSLERVRDEMDKLLLAEKPDAGLDVLVRSGLAACCCRVKEEGEYHMVPILPELAHLVGMPQNPCYHAYDAWGHTLAAVNFIPPTLTLRWAALLHDVAKGLPGIRETGEDGQPTDHGHDVRGAEITEKILSRLRFPMPMMRRVVWLVSRHMRFYFNIKERSRLERWLRKEARTGCFRSSDDLAEAFGQLAEVCVADARASGKMELASGDHERNFGRALAELARQMPVRTSDLRFNAGEVMTALGDKRYMGDFLRTVLSRAQDGSLVNAPDAIQAAAVRWGARHKTNLK